MKPALIGIGLALASVMPASAEESFSTDVAARVSSLGFGVELSHRFMTSFGARLGYNTFSGDFDERYDGILYEMDVALGSVAATLDWYPSGSGFRLSGGVLFNNNELDGVAIGDGLYDIGGNTYLLSDVGTLSGKVGFDKTVPYAGLGWANSPRSPFGVSIEAGIAFQGEPNVALTATGDFADNPVFQADIAEEERNLQAELADYEYYPVVALGLSYRF